MPYEPSTNPNWVFIENDGALFRGPWRDTPMEVWSAAAGAFVPYTQRGKPRDVSWGTVITPNEAYALMDQPKTTPGE